MPKTKTSRKSVVAKDQVFGGAAYFNKDSGTDKFESAPSEGKIEALVGTKNKDRLKSDDAGARASSSGYDESKTKTAKKKSAAKAKSTVDEIINSVKEAIKKPGGATNRDNY